MKILLFGSGNGTNANAVITASRNSQLGEGKVVGVISNIDNAGINQVASDNQIPCSQVITKSKTGRLLEEEEIKLIEMTSSFDPDLIVLAGFTKILGKMFLNTFKNQVINLHPSLLPSFKGLDAIKDSFELGVKITGCTIHLVDEKVDHGKIIAQAPVRIMPGDTLESVENKVRAAEHMLLPWVLADIANGILEMPRCD